MITDGMYAEKPEHLEGEQLTKALDEIRAPCLYEGPCSEEMIQACPGGAITEDGIDKAACRDYCRNCNETTPVPEICGKSFRFKR